MSLSHSAYLEDALKEAQIAFNRNEVPVGAIVVHNDQIIARGHNLKETQNDVSAHAEIMAIKNAAKALGTWHLEDMTLYTTLEPCLMCYGAILHARLKQVIFGAKDPKGGVCGSVIDLTESKIMNHQTPALYVPSKECSSILSEFFKGKRK